MPITSFEYYITKPPLPIASPSGISVQKPKTAPALTVKCYLHSQLRKAHW